MVLDINWWDSHLIIIVSLEGLTFTQTVWASNNDKQVNQDFGRDVSASVRGITNQGNYDTTVYQEAQYKTFQNLEQRLVSVLGGDSTLASDLLNNPDDYSKYVAWSKTSLTNPDLMSFRTVGIWELMKDAGDSLLVKYANAVQDAFTFITTKTKPIQTAISFRIDAHWAEFGLLTPSTVIAAYPDDPAASPDGPPVKVSEGFVQSETKVRLGDEDNNKRIKATIECVASSSLFRTWLTFQ